MKHVFLLLIRTLILLLIGLASAVAAMRLAIHGREVRVPRLVGLTPAQAEQVALSHGLILQSEGKFYSAEVPLGRILSQMPAPDSKIRRGWWVRVVESLGPQRAPVPNVIGESIRAAELNVTRRGLELGEVAQAALPDFQSETVLAQSPSPELQHISSPRVNLLTAAPPANTFFVMPKLVGKHVSDVIGAIEQAGFPAPKVRIAPPAVSGFDASADEDSNVAKPGATKPDSPVGLIVRQSPAAGTKISQSTQITLEVAR